MNGHIFTLRTKHLMLAAAGGLVGGLLFVNGPVVAQPSQEITVVAPHEVQRKTVGRSAATGAAVEVFSLTRRVNYADLDLTKHADVTVLENRVKDTAKESCKRLDELYPEAMYPSSPSTQKCTKLATDDGMVQVRAAVAAAHNK